MRLLRGTRVIEAGEGWRDAIGVAGRPIVIDVGTGDGRYPYEHARADAASFHIGIDPDADALSEYAYRAARKPARGGVANVAYIVAAVEGLPPELACTATLVTVVFPWQSLLRGVLLPEPAVLAAIAGLATPEGRFELILCYDPQHDQAALAGASLARLDEAYIDAVLTPAYAAAGIAIDGRRRLEPDEALALPSTWGRRLLHGRAREVFRVRGGVTSNR